MASNPGIALEALTPRIVTFTDEQVDRSCQLNGCKSLDELFKPWQSTVESVPILSSTLSVTTHSSFSVRFTSHSALLQSQFGGGGTIPYSPDIAADIISNLIHSAIHGDDNPIQYEVLKDVLLASAPVDGQGTFNHPVCRLFAISTSNPTPFDTLGRLTRIAGNSSVFATKPYIESSFKNSLRFYLVVHDVSQEGDDLTRARQILFQLEQQYGPHCSLLVINSSLHSASQEMATNKPASEFASNSSYHAQYATALKRLGTVDPFTRLTDMLAEDVLVERSAIGLIVRKPSSESPSFHYARYLGKEDISNIRDCIRGLIVQSVIPWMEARVREWNEVFLQSRKGIAGKLFGAGKRLFGDSENGTPTAARPDDNPFYSAAHYTVRRSADFAFMLRDYKSAKSLYEAVRQDYLDDRALMSMPNVVVMHILSSLLELWLETPAPATFLGGMLQPAHRVCGSIILVQQALNIQQSSPFRQLDLLRDLLYFVESLTLDSITREPRCSAQMSKLFVSAAQAQREQLFSAILLERAAFFDAQVPRSRTRKRALHLALSAWQYQQCGQRFHHAKCLLQALHCLQRRTSTWRYIEGSLQYDLGQQALRSGDGLSAAKHFSESMKRGLGAASQMAIFSDVLAAYQRFYLRAEQVSVSGDGWLSAPSFISAIIITCLSKRVNTYERPFEVMALPGLETIHSSFPSPNNNAVGDHFSSVCNALCDGAFRVVVGLVNRSNVPFASAGLRLLVLDDHGNPAEDASSTPEMTSFLMFPLEKRLIYFDVILKKPMLVEIASLVYSLAGTFHCSHRLSLVVSRQPSTQSSSPKLIDREPRSIRPRATQSTSPLRCWILDLPHVVDDGEIAPLSICVQNDGSVCIRDMQLYIKDHRRVESLCVTDFEQSVPGVLYPTEKVSINALVPIWGEGEINVEIALEYKQDRCATRARIVFNRVIYVSPSISSSVSSASESEVEGLPVSLINLQLESRDGNRNFHLISLNLIRQQFQSPSIPRMVEAILRMRQLYRDHAYACLLCGAEEGESTIQMALPLKQRQRCSYLAGGTSGVHAYDTGVLRPDTTLRITVKTSPSENFWGSTKIIQPSSFTIKREVYSVCSVFASSVAAVDGTEGTPLPDQEHPTADFQMIVLQLVDVITLSVEDKCAHIGIRPQRVANDRARHSQARFVVWNRSSHAKMQWKLRSAESVSADPFGPSPTYTMGRTQFAGVLLPGACATPISSILHGGAGHASLRDWVLEWVHGDTDNWRMNPNFQHRFQVMLHACQGFAGGR